jgi:hypothetical protein
MSDTNLGENYIAQRLQTPISPKTHESNKALLHQTTNRTNLSVYFCIANHKQVCGIHLGCDWLSKSWQTFLE